MARHISYSDTTAPEVQVARAVRLHAIWQSGKAIGGKNIAVAYAEAGLFSQHNLAIHAASDPSERTHSEPALMAKIGMMARTRYEDLDSDSKAVNRINFWIAGGRIKWLYTERAPCGKGPGMANCDGFLATTFPALPVSYSFQYPSGGAEELKTIKEIHASLGILDEADFMTLREYFLELGKKDRTEVTETLKGIDKTFSKLDDKNRRARLGEQLQVLFRQQNLIVV